MSREAAALLRSALMALVLCTAGCPDESPPGAGDGGATTAPIISALQVTTNPTNVLALTVSWTTDKDATSTVEFGEGGLFYRTGQTAMVKEHRVLVIGLHAQSEVLLRAVSVGADGAKGVSEVKRTTTGQVPAYLPHGRVTVHDRRRAQAGYTLMTVNAAQRKGLVITQDNDFTPVAVMYDMDGRPVWYNAHDLGRIGDTRFVDNHVLVQSMADVTVGQPIAVEVDLAGTVVWTGPKQPLGSVDGHHHHHFEKLAGGTYLAVRSRLIGLTTGDVVVEMDSAGKELWSWNTFRYLRPDTALDDGEGQGVFSWTHINAVHLDKSKGFLLINARNLSQIFKVDLKTGEILWAFGKGGEFAPDPNDPYPWFEQPHGMELLPSGNLIMYDNGSLKRGFTRAVEYALDEEQRTSRIVWQYRGGLDGRWFVNYWGDADRLKNGNTLITYGTWQTGDHSRLMEVTPDGELVWEMELPIRESTGTTVGVYNSQRLDPPLMERITP